MRTAFDQPAQQLQSIALRYRQPLARRRLGVRADECRWWWITAARRAAPAGSSTIDRRRQRVEAILLLAREPLNSRKLAQYAGLADGTEARTLVRRLNQLYDSKQRAFRVEEVGGGFQMLTRPQFGPWLRRLEHVPSEMRLSAPALETLAVVAYCQPVIRAEIEAIRGVGCGEILRQLMDRDLVRIGGRSDELGRPYLYTTTRRFLQLFGLQNLDQLPRPEPLARQRDTTGETADTTRTGSATGAEQQEEKSAVKTTSSRQPIADSLFAQQPLPTSTEAAMSAAPSLIAPFDDDDLDDDYDDDLDDDDLDDDLDDDFDEDPDEDSEDDLDDDWEEVEDDDYGDEFDEDEFDDDEDYDEDDLEGDDLEDDEELEGDWEEVGEDEFDEDEEEDDQWVEDYDEDYDEDEDEFDDEDI